MESSPQRLTKRQAEVLYWASQGKTSWCIGQILCISENTVLYHMKKIHQKFNVTTRQQAILKATQAGLLDNVTPRFPLPVTMAKEKFQRTDASQFAGALRLV